MQRPEQNIRCLSLSFTVYLFALRQGQGLSLNWKLAVFARLATNEVLGCNCFHPQMLSLQVIDMHRPALLFYLGAEDSNSGLCVSRASAPIY